MEKEICLNCVNQMVCINNQNIPAMKNGKKGYYLPIGNYNNKKQKCDKYERDVENEN